MIDFAPLVQAYLEEFPAEQLKLERLNALLTAFPASADLIARTNFVGHVTGSAFIIHPTRKAMLLVFHKGLGIYVQPGGHLDITDATPLEGARREAREETGLHTLTQLIPYETALIPIDIDIHPIPENPKKGEDAHWHHDFRYAFFCEDNAEVTLNEAEVGQMKWVALKDLAQYPTFEHVAPKLVTLTQSLLPHTTTTETTSA